METQSWALERIKPHEKNPREHPRKQIELLAKLLSKYGIDQPIVVDEDGVILKGHGRLLAAIEAGMAEFPVVVRTGLTEQDKAGIRIADNQVALLAGWDSELLRSEVEELSASGFDIGLLGFRPVDLENWGIQNKIGDIDPDAVPEPVKNPVVRQGDFWNLGEHILVCDDATLAEAWIGCPSKAAMVFTDPPYGVSYQTTSNKFEIIQGDERRRDDLYKMLLSAFKNMATSTRDTGAFYIWHASSTREDFAQAMNAAGLIERQYLIWVKPGNVLGHADYQWQHEPCFYASKGNTKPVFYGDRAQSTVWHVQTGGSKGDVAATIGNGLLILDGKGGKIYVQSNVPKNRKLRQLRLSEGASAYLSGSDRKDGTVWEVARDIGYLHPTQKPVELARRAIQNSSKEGELVIDCFLGSGTTLVAAELTRRKCFCIELDPIYAQVAIERWERIAGKKALLNGKTLDEMKRERLNASGNFGKSIPGNEPRRKNPKQAVRKKVHARFVKKGRKSARESSAVAGNS